MLDKGKLTFWDICTYLTIGFFVFLLLIVYLVVIFDIKIDIFYQILSNCSAFIIILTPIMFLFVGMFIEPIANCLIKIIEKCCLLKPKANKYKKKLELLIQNKIYDDISGINKYRYCKAIVELKFPSSNHNIFLARFGFYRSLCFLMIVVFFLNIFFIEQLTHMFSINFIILVMSYLFLRRSQSFKNHMENVVYYNYLALVSVLGKEMLC